MFFNNKAKYKNNFLSMAVPSTIEGYYKRYEFKIYDELRDLAETKGNLTEQDVIPSIRMFREFITRTLVEALKKEYSEASDDAQELLKELYDDNYENMQQYGPRVSCVYIVIVKCVLGADSEGVKIDEVAGDLLKQLDELERTTIQSSIDILMEDGLLGNIDLGGIL